MRFDMPGYVNLDVALLRFVPSPEYRDEIIEAFAREMALYIHECFREVMGVAAYEGSKKYIDEKINRDWGGTDAGSES